MVYLKVGGILREATFKDSIDPFWDRREIKTITFPQGVYTVEEVKAFLYDGVEWSIYIPDPNAQDIELDYSQYSLRGDITEHRDRSISVKMGKPI